LRRGFNLFSLLMGVGRYELTDAQWSRVDGLLPGRGETVSRTAADNRVFINGVLWVLRSGAHWDDLSERYGKYKSVYKRFSRWAASGVWDKVFRDLVADRKNLCLMIDSTIVHIHQQTATGRKKRGTDKALGRSRGGLTTKIHLLANELGLTVDFLLTGGQVNDCTQAIELLGERQAEWVLADKGYDSQIILDHIKAMVAVVPSKSNRKQQ
jgi:transposase